MNKEKRLLLQIADIGFLIRWIYPALADPSDACYDAFLHYRRIETIKEQLKQVSSVNVHWAQKKDKRPCLDGAQRLLVIPKFWTLYKNEKHYIMEIFHPAQDRLLSMAEITPDFKKVDYYLLASDRDGQRILGLRGQDFWLLTRLIQPLLRSLFINILAKHGGCLAHGVGVKIGNQGMAFIGKSGSGKTTLAKFLRRYKDITVLTDENLAIAKKNNRIYIYGTPWPGGGRIANPYDAPLKKIFFISHGKDNVIKPISPSVAFKEMISQAILCAWDRTLVESIISFVRKLTSEIECWDLKFVKDKSVVSFIRNNC